VVAAGSGHPGRKNFAGLQHEIFKDFIILIIDEFDFIFAKKTILSS